MKKRTDPLLRQVVSRMKKARRILLTGHRDPDGDSLGSLTALLKAFSNLGQEAFAVEQPKAPDNLKFLGLYGELADLVLPAEDLDFADFDLLITVDCAALDRIVGFEEIPSNLALINIDHHRNNDQFGAVNVVRRAAATTEIIYDLLDQFGVKPDSMIAESLYTGLSTDTGSFQYPNTTGHTMVLAGKLMETGFDFRQVVDHLYNSHSLHRMRMIGAVLSSLEESEEVPGLTWMYITRKMQKRLGTSPEDLQGLANHLNTIRGLKVGVLLIELEDTVRASLRSKEGIPVDEVAKHFGGGGHARAAGFESDMNFQKIKDEITKAVKEYIC